MQEPTAALDVHEKEGDQNRFRKRDPEKQRLKTPKLT
jgi:hypothetical protein